MKPLVNARRGLFVLMLTAVCVYPVESARILNEPDGKALARYFYFVLSMDMSTEDLRKELDGVLELIMISFSVGMIDSLQFCGQE